MIITYHNGGFIKITNGDTTVAINPISKKSNLKEVRFGADLALVSVNHSDCNGIDSVIRSGKDMFVIDGAGEYEVGGVFTKGVAVNTKYDGEEMINIIYSLYIEDIHILYLGALGNEKLTSKMLGGIDDIDILFVPVGAENGESGTLDATMANKLANSLEAKMVIPIFYDENSLKTYLKEASAEGVKAIEKLVIKKKDLEGKIGEIVILSV